MIKTDEKEKITERISDWSNRHGFVSCLTLIIIFISSVIIYNLGRDFILNNFGQEKINSWFEKEEYSTYYYISMFPSGSVSKNYRVKAKIFHWMEMQDYYDSYKNVKRYSISEIYWPNGGSNYFEDDCSLMGESFSNFFTGGDCVDNEGRHWQIFLSEVQ